MRRSLTTILAADIVGFSRLVEQDEEGTLAAQHQHRIELIDPLIARYVGRIANTAGDSLLVEFDSTVEAVRFAIAIQDGMCARNAGQAADRRIEYRIGINVGDVVRDGDDLMGDAVNIAARLEAAAAAGGVVLSAAALEHVKDRIPVQVDDLGALSVKNISRPVPAYAISTPGASPVRRLQTNRSKRLGLVLLSVLLAIALSLALWRGDIGWPGFGQATASALPSVAVLPFDNISPDADQVYFADGLADDLITDLSKIEKVRVISRSSSFDYRDKSGRIAAISRDFDVRYVVEGSVRRQADDLRITARVIDAEDGTTLWSERFEGSRSDVFGFQDQIASNVIAALRLQLSPTESAAIETRATDNAAAHDAYLDGLRLLSSRERFAPDKNAKAQRRFEKAIALDPAFAEAYAGLAWAKWLHVERINFFDLSNYTRSIELAEDSIAIRDNSLARRTLANANYPFYTEPWGMKRDLDRAVAEMRRAAVLQPNDSDTLADLAMLLSFAGEPAEAVDLASRARQRNPNYPVWYFAASGIARLLSGDATGSLEDLEQWNSADLTFPMPYVFLGAALALSGQPDEGRIALSRFEDLSNNQSWRTPELDENGLPIITTTTYAVKRRLPMAPNQEELFLRGLRLAGMKD